MGMVWCRVRSREGIVRHTSIGGATVLWGQADGMVGGGFVAVRGNTPRLPTGSRPPPVTEARRSRGSGHHFAPRVKAPVLMLNGRYDDYFLLAASQLPLFRLLGTPEKDKRHVVYEAGQGGYPEKEVIRETLDWLDKYLGPVRRSETPF